MGTRTTYLLSFLLLVSAYAFGTGSTYLEWKQEPYYIDGIAFPPEEILEFTIHYGVNSGEYIYQQTVPANQFNLELIVPTSGIWYIAATVTNIYLETSMFSNEVRREILPFRKPKPMKITGTVIE